MHPSLEVPPSVLETPSVVLHNPKPSEVLNWALYWSVAGRPFWPASPRLCLSSLSPLSLCHPSPFSLLPFSPRAARIGRCEQAICESLSRKPTHEKKKKRPRKEDVRIRNFHSNIAPLLVFPFPSSSSDESRTDNLTLAGSNCRHLISLSFSFFPLLLQLGTLFSS